MTGLVSVSPALVLFLIPAIGVVSALVARRGEGTLRQVSYRRVFWGFFALVGITSIVATVLQLGGCLVCGTLLAVMALTATYDHGASPQRQHYLQ